MSPKKKAAKTTQKPIITIELGLGCLEVERTGPEEHGEHATTSAGDPSRIASVKRLRTNVSSVRWVRTRPLREPARRWLACSRLGGRSSGGGAPTAAAATCAAVPSAVGEAAVELRDGADPEVLECLVEGPDEATRPPRAMNTMRSHWARSSTEWVVNTTVAERSARWRRRAISSALVTGSRPDVGSSRKKTCGSVSSSTAMLARLRCPPLSEPTRTSACAVEADGVDRVTDRAVDLGRARRRREPEPRGVAEHAPERQVGVDDVVLGHVAEHAAERPRVGVHVDAVEAHRPRGRRGERRRSPRAASSCRRRSDRRSRPARRPRP